MRDLHLSPRLRSKGKGGNRLNTLSVIHATILALTLALGSVGQHEHHQHSRVDDVNRRGDHAMGFSHTKTTHHFRLYEDGGAIEVEANDAADTESRDQIRMHLAHIATMFAEGDFSTPRAVHDEEPSGANAMAKFKSDISYNFETTERGGRVRIQTASKDALAAIHDFLRYQIRDHQTGDSLEVQKKN